MITTHFSSDTYLHYSQILLQVY